MATARTTRRCSARLVALALVCGAAGVGCAHRTDAVAQYSTVGALLDGFYEGDLSIGELGRPGDFGLGAVNALDGELVALDGRFYTARADGRLYPLAADARTPFSVVKHFRPETTRVVSPGLDYRALRAHLDSLVASRNRMQAIRIRGHFRRLVVRSEPRQEPPNVPGYHFHFASENRALGGHILELETASGTIEIDESTELRLVVPGTDGLSHLDLSTDRRRELESVEHRGSGR